MRKIRSPNSPNANPPREGPTHCRLLSLPPSHCCTIVESVSEGVLTVDLEKKVTYLNPAAEAMTGFTPKEHGLIQYSTISSSRRKKPSEL